MTTFENAIKDTDSEIVRLRNENCKLIQDSTTVESRYHSAEVY